LKIIIGASGTAYPNHLNKTPILYNQFLNMQGLYSLLEGFRANLKGDEND
jgi:hypothetical protein